MNIIFSLRNLTKIQNFLVNNPPPKVKFQLFFFISTRVILKILSFTLIIMEP